VVVILDNTQVKLPKDNSRFFFYGLLLFVILISSLIFLPLLGAITMAFLTTAMFHPVYRFILKIVRSTDIASGLSVVVVILVALIPLLLVGQLTAYQIIQFSNDAQEYTKNHPLSLDGTVGYANDILRTLPILDQEITVEQARTSIDQSISSVARAILDFVVRTGASTPDLLSQFFIYIFLLFFFFPLQKKIPKLISNVSPLRDELNYTFINKAIAMAESMVSGIFVISFIQAVAGAILLSLLGTPYVIFWTVTMFMMGVIPVVGASAVLYAIGVAYLLTGGIWQGLLIFAVTTLVISNIDNILRPKLVSKDAQLHPALVLIGVLGGLKAFGLLGIIYGPVIMILLTTMLSVFESNHNPRLNDPIEDLDQDYALKIVDK